MASVSLSLLFSLTIIAFLVAFTIRTPKRWIVIAAFSIFYLILINPKTVLLFIIVCIINFSIVKRLKNAAPYAILGNLLFLAFFKYLPGMRPNELSFMLPLGISIFVFQQLAILIDSLGETKENEFSNLSLSSFLAYSFFWGNFATGPILKTDNLVDGFTGKILFSSRQIITALVYVLIGSFKIFVVAGHLNTLTISLFLPLDPHSNYIVPFLANKYEIFANFSGYSDVAIGIGLLFGITLPENFDRPFHTTSIIEFWKRWHMSLSAWIRQYIFYPLLTTRLSKLGPYGLMLITFTVFALWHGIKWTYFLYGLIQVFLIFFTYKWRLLKTKKASNIIIIFFQWIWFYVILLSIPGVLFRAEDLQQFGEVMQNIYLTKWNNILAYLLRTYKPLLLALTGIVIVELLQRLSYQRIIDFLRNQKIITRFICFLMFAFLIFLLRSSGYKNGFIYSLF